MCKEYFVKKRFGGQTIGTVLHMSVGPFGPGIGIYSNRWEGGGRGGLPPPRANPYTRKKSMGVNSDDFSIFLIVY